jgi:hypothetical protein
MAGSTKLMTAGGGGVALTPASSIASDVTVNVPSQNCTLGIQGPAFSAYQSSAQTPSAGVWTKVQYQTEEFDTNNNFDSTTNYQFTPTVAGYYQITGRAENGSAFNVMTLSIYKNGSAFKNSSYGSTMAGVQISCLVYFNGSTDYVEAYVNQSSSNALVATPAGTYFQGVLVRAA